jgi:NTP pyrophosphatase (non-canonical NTP hydrolase)
MEENIFELIREWGKEKGILEKSDIKTQYVKLQEESGELARSIIKNNDEEFKDSIGDMVVVLTLLAKLNNMNIEDCIQSAYDIISKREGKMVNGSFIKDQ